MSLLALARQRLAELSQREVPMDCPNGTLANETARDALRRLNGTSLRRVPAGHFRDNGTIGTLGTGKIVEALGNETEREVLRCPTGLSQRDVPTGHSAEAAERLRSYPCPDGFSPSRWRLLQGGAARFAEEWGGRALALGWTEAELFTFAEPFARVDIQGAAWFVGSATVAAVTADAITLRTKSGSRLRLYRRGLQ